ncbi:MAG: succinate dehydrogenase cytochrome b subunit [Oligoflexia bacterium]|nr:succinate dehydrogenase cytochrome b subunit [Oligoflexia bacterium]
MTTVAKKFIMALSGLALVGFVITHLLGNLTLYSHTDEPFNAYAFKLHSFGSLLLVAEVGLVAIFLTHIVYGLTAKKTSLSARPKGYRVWRSKGGETPSNISSRNMAISGSILLAFVLLHVWQFRFGPAIEAGYVTTMHGEQARDLHRLIVETFKNPAWVAVYVAAMLFLGLHLRHGFWSAFQSAGLTRHNTTVKLRIFGGLLAAALTVGFLFIPVYIYFAF